MDVWMDNNHHAFPAANCVMEHLTVLEEMMRWISTVPALQRGQLD